MQVIKPCWANCSESAKGVKEAREKCTEDFCYPQAMAADKKVRSVSEERTGVHPMYYCPSPEFTSRS